jgi:hypothetical protein
MLCGVCRHFSPARGHTAPSQHEHPTYRTAPLAEQREQSELNLTMRESAYMGMGMGSKAAAPRHALQPVGSYGVGQHPVGQAASFSFTSMQMPPYRSSAGARRQRAGSVRTHNK